MKKQYFYYGIDVALKLLRPGAKCIIYNNSIINWEDPRPAPTWTEIEDTLEKIKVFEDSIETLYLEDYQQEEKVVG